MANKKQPAHWLSGKYVSRNRIIIGKHLAALIHNYPRIMLRYMSYYKFAAKMIGCDKSILDIDCGEGMGTWLLAKECGHAEGIDSDQEAIAQARINWNTDSVRFYHGDIYGDILNNSIYDAIVSFATIESILPKNISNFYSAIVNRLNNVGIVIVGKPNLDTDEFATAITHAKHSNLYSAESLETDLRQYFKHVFIFSAHNEVIHTGYYPRSHYLLAVACQKR